ncbi:MAG: FAD-dependent oxidoreductase [Deltaproteobacteria bacterium]|nr:FAD-dependent oxidoreductase [Deltaproteobacteria bacterium]
MSATLGVVGAGERSYWQERQETSSSPSHALRPLEGALTVDYAVVGAGFSGLATAYFLKRAEPAARVVVLDAGRVGASGASGRSAGLVTTGFGLSLSSTVKAFGGDRARQAHEYLEQGVELVERLVKQNRIDCGYERNGLLRVATTPSWARRVREEVVLARALGLHGIDWLDASAVREQVESPLFLGAAWNARAALVDPARLAWGLRDVLERAGVQLHEGTPALRIERRLGRLFVRTPRGSILAEKLAIATNAYSDPFPALRRKQVALAAHAVVSEPLRAEQLKAIGWRGRQAIADARNLARFYRLTPDGRLLIGGRGVGLSSGRLSSRIFARLEDDARVLFPSLQRLRFPYRWSGLVSMPMQLIPALGHLGSERIVYSLGCMGQGIALAHMNGWTLADLLRGEKTERTSAFFVNRRVVPWPQGPLRLVLALAMRTLLRAEDAWSERGLPQVPKPPPLRLVPKDEEGSPGARESSSAHRDSPRRSYR